MGGPVPQMALSVRRPNYEYTILASCVTSAQINNVLHKVFVAVSAQLQVPIAAVPADRDVRVEFRSHERDNAYMDTSIMP
jgi:hypothetical protein